MAMFNSYVSLPEGTMDGRKSFTLDGWNKMKP